MSEFDQQPQQTQQEEGADLLGDLNNEVNTEAHEVVAEINNDKQQQDETKELATAEIDERVADVLSQAAASAPSAPASSSNESETNGFYVVDKQTTPAVVAEADSSSSPPDDNNNSTTTTASSEKKTETKKPSSDEKQGGEEDPCPYSALCPYYFLACDYVSKVQLPASVEDLLLWKNPKVSGAVFGSLFTLLLSLACCSLLTVVSSLLLLALTVSGSYRFYLAVVFRINGVQDPTFEKLGEFDVSLPADRVKQLANLLETDFNKALLQLKSVLLWEQATQTQLGAFIGLYVVYCVGSIFNMSTLLILTLVSAFSLPKVYQMYKTPIDQCIVQATDAVHGVCRQVSAKVPFLNKKKHE